MINKHAVLSDIEAQDNIIFSVCSDRDDLIEALKSIMLRLRLDFNTTAVEVSAIAEETLKRVLKND